MSHVGLPAAVGAVYRGLCASPTFSASPESLPSTLVRTPSLCRPARPALKAKGRDEASRPALDAFLAPGLAHARTAAQPLCALATPRAA
jgi:hypothetical protein